MLGAVGTFPSKFTSLLISSALVSPTEYCNCGDVVVAFPNTSQIEIFSTLVVVVNEIVLVVPVNEVQAPLSILYLYVLFTVPTPASATLRVIVIAF